MSGERTSVGLDVHARSVAAAAIDGVTGELRQAKLDSENAARAAFATLDVTQDQIDCAIRFGQTGAVLRR